MTKPNSTKFPFTARTLDSLKPADKAYDCRDSGAPGLALRVSPTGRKTFRWTFRDITGKHRVKTLGDYGDRQGQITLSNARRTLEVVKARHRDSLRLGESEASINTIGELAELFFEHRLKKTRKRPEEARRLIDKDILPTLGKLRLMPIPSTPVIGKAVIAVVDRGAPVHAGKVLDLIRQLFDFGVANGYLIHNPASPLRGSDLGVEEYTPCNRRLEGDQIREFWLALDGPHKMSTQTRCALRIILLTGVRSQEMLLARWEHLNLETSDSSWIIPIVNQKLTLRQSRTARDFVIPLAPKAVELFLALKNLAGNSPWVMASEATGGHYNDKALGKAMRRLFAVRVRDQATGELVPLLDFAPISPHDLRRTMRSMMGETLRIAPHIAERCLNHSLGTLTMTYDTGEYLDERREAMNRWAEYVEMQANRSSNVTFLTKQVV